MSGKYFVYEHVRPDTGAIFYVGKGYGRRATQMYRRNLHHRNIQQKLLRDGLCVEVVFVSTALTEAEAFALERTRVAHSSLSHDDWTKADS